MRPSLLSAKRGTYALIAFARQQEEKTCRSFRTIQKSIDALAAQQSAVQAEFNRTVYASWRFLGILFDFFGPGRPLEVG